MNTTKQRHHWADVAKGILILIVIFHHIPQVALSKGRDTAIWNGMNDIRYFYCCFFMAAFFLLTGFCSNFNKDFKTFFVNSLKSLILPAIAIGCIILFANAIIDKTRVVSVLKGVVRLIVFGGQNWFLSSLFIARIVYWIINYVAKPQVFKCMISLCIMAIGFSLHDSGVINIWFFQHAFAMTFFLYVGDYAKQTIKNDFVRLKNLAGIGASFFLIIWSLLFLFGLRIPSLNAGFKVTSVDIPMYVILSLTGSCIIVFLSIIINSNKLLEYLGKNSLTIYLFQIFFINIVLDLLNKVIQDNNTPLTQIATIGLSLLLVPLLCVGASALFNTKNLRFLIGK